MSVDRHIEELTDLYLRGELSGKDLESFEQLKSSDTAVNEHVQLQEKVIDGITNYRRIQLKSRLDAIEVGTGYFGTGVLAEGLLKIGGGIVLATLIGSGVYYTTLSDDLVPEEQKVEISLGANEITETEELPSVPVVISSEDEEVGEKEETLVLPKKNTTASEERTVVLEELIEESRKPAEFVPEVNVPSFNDVSDQEFKSNDISIPEASINDIIDEDEKSPIDIKTFNRNSTEIRYRYFDGKLFLYGDFNKEPYEILEINSKSSRQIYLYYSEKYYEVEVSDEIKTLRPILGDKLLNELKIIRENKLN